MGGMDTPDDRTWTLGDIVLTGAKAYRVLGSPESKPLAMFDEDAVAADLASRVQVSTPVVVN